ncbi:MAG: ABC transporter substrate-binding protein [Candidatus Methanomethyliaceae archaeon]|nr:ABC transporter substrate-binding protein [Candidatus Methanomethyliaceae archaeon]MDW7970828.1 ABC transporter substrate-binding protein [Nitrososphaerota archaeon]
MKKSTIVLSIILLVLIVSAGAYAIPSIFYKKEKIRVGYLTGDLHHLALFVALANNYFAERGLELELYEYVNGPTLMQHFIAGELDFAYVGTPPALTARARGIGTNNTNIPVVIGSANLEGSALVVNPNIIKKISDLNNKRIGTPGTGTIQDVMITIYAKANNITITKYPGRIADLVLQYGRGEIDGFIGWEPFPSMAIHQHNASILLTSRDIMPNHQCCVLVTTERMYNTRPDIVERVISAHNVAIDFILSNPSAAKKIAVERTKLPEPVVEMALSRIKFSKTVNVETIRTFLSEMISLGIIKEVDRNQIDEFIRGFVRIPSK